MQSQPLSPEEKKEVQQQIDENVENTYSMQDESENFYKDLNITWESLKDLNKELAAEFLKFTSDTFKIIANPQIYQTLGPDAAAFSTSSKIFLRDVHNFSEDIRNISKQFEDKSGVILTDEDYDLYNRMTFLIQSKYQEIMAVLSPVLTDIVIILNENSDKLYPRTNQEVSVEHQDVQEETSTSPQEPPVESEGEKENG